MFNFNDTAGMPRGLRLVCLVLFGSIFSAGTAAAQTGPESPWFARKNTFGVFTAYSNDSSHMLLGTTENRKLLEIGGTYSRRLMLNHIVNWQYNAEIQPVALESDPLVHTVVTYTEPKNLPPITGTFAPIGACHSGSGTVTIKVNKKVYSYNYVDTCSRQWTIGQAMSPVGFQWNFRPRSRLQPLIVGHGGYMYSTHPIPTASAGSFNFTFDLGAGFELYRSHSQSIRADWRYHHISDHFTSPENPGIDNGVFQVTYSFGH